MIVWVVRMNGIEVIDPRSMVFSDNWIKKHRLAIMELPENTTDCQYRYPDRIDYVVDGKIRTMILER